MFIINNQDVLFDDTTDLINLMSIKFRRFPIIDRAVLKARLQIMSQEDDLIFKAMETNILNNK